MESNLVNSMHVEFLADYLAKFKLVNPALARIPFITTAMYTMCNAGNIHREIISVDEAKTLAHVIGDPRIAIQPTGNYTFRFSADKRIADLAIEQEQYQLLQDMKQELGEAQSQGRTLDKSKMMALNDRLNVLSTMVQNRLRQIYQDMESWAFNGVTANSNETPTNIYGLRQLLSDTSRPNIQKATGGHANKGQGASHSIFLLNMDRYCGIIYPQESKGVLDVGQWEHITNTHTNSNNQKTRSDTLWLKINVAFGIRAVQDLKHGAYGCARLCNIKEFSSSASTGTIHDPKVREQLHILARKVESTYMSNGNFIYAFVDSILFEEMRTAYHGIYIQNPSSGIQFTPRLITDINVKGYTHDIRGISQYNHFMIGGNIVVIETSGLDIPELSL